MKEKFEISNESLARLAQIQSDLVKECSAKTQIISPRDCTCCWGGWCANGCTG